MDYKTKMQILEQAKIDFPINLKKARTASNITQKDLGELVGRSSDSISQLERGIRLPFFQEFKQIGELLNKGDDFFFPNGVPYLEKYNAKSITATKKRLNKYGKSELSEEEVKELTEKVSIGGKIFDIENEISPKSDIEIVDSEEIIDDVEEKVNMKVEEIVDVIEKLPIKESQLTLEEIPKATKPLSRKVQIGIPLGDKNITIIIEEQ